MGGTRAIFLIKDREHIQTLTKLGLSLLQAKVYLSLVALGKSDAKTISKSSDIVREEIYRIMPALEKHGLVEKILGRPTIYKALPLKEGLSSLLQRRTEENVELQRKTKALVQNLQEIDLGNTFSDENFQFIITSEKTLFRKRFETCVNLAKTKIDIILTKHVFGEMVFHHLQSFENAKRKGVEIRVITNGDKDGTIPEEPQVLTNNHLFKVKYLPTHVPVTMAIFDDNELNMRISDDLVPNLWSDNPMIVKLAKNYFNEIWNKKRPN
jgi:sugar-specific transcriptional regulator TrmB